jgi:hypothetical protein
MENGLSKTNETKFEIIWNTLRNHDVTPYVEKIPSGSFQAKYITWTAAWKILMHEFPNSNYEFHDTVWEGEGYASVSCTVTIEDHPRYMWLPVMDNRHNAKKNPTTRDISDARMRCLVKCLAMFGLGIDIYSKEDLPDPHFDNEPKQKPKPEPKPEAPPVTDPEEKRVAGVKRLTERFMECKTTQDVVDVNKKYMKHMTKLEREDPKLFKTIHDYKNQRYEELRKETRNA